MVFDVKSLISSGVYELRTVVPVYVCMLATDLLGSSVEKLY